MALQGQAAWFWSRHLTLVLIQMGGLEKGGKRTQFTVRVSLPLNTKRYQKTQENSFEMHSVMPRRNLEGYRAGMQAEQPWGAFGMRCMEFSQRNRMDACCCCWHSHRLSKTLVKNSNSSQSPCDPVHGMSFTVAFKDKGHFLLFYMTLLWVSVICKTTCWWVKTSRWCSIPYIPHRAVHIHCIYNGLKTSPNVYFSYFWGDLHGL